MSKARRKALARRTSARPAALPGAVRTGPAAVPAADQPVQDRSAPADQAPASNSRQQSNYESNFPDGTSPGSGAGLTHEARAPVGAQVLGREHTYGPAPARAEIVSSEADPTARDHPADAANPPASLITGSDNQEYLRHYSSPAGYAQWRRRARGLIKP